MPEIILHLKNSVSLKNSNQTNADLQGSGFIAPIKKQKHLARRVKANGFSLQLCDMGFVAAFGGGYVDLPFSSIPPLLDNASNPVRSILIDDFTARDEYIFGSYDVEDFENVFSKINKNQFSFYKLGIYNGSEIEHLDSDSTVWNETGDSISVPENFQSSELFSVFGGEDTLYPIFAPEIRLKGNGRNKITAIRDFAADPVSFQLKGKNIIFLLPALIFSVAVSIQAASGDTLYKRLNYFYTIYDRSTFLNPSDPYFNYPANANWNVSGGDSGSENYQKAWQSIQLQKRKQSARAFYNSVSNQTIVNETLADFPDTGVFPPHPSYPSSPNASFLGTAQEKNYTTPDEALVAVIKQNNNFFYVWEEKIYD